MFLRFVIFHLFNAIWWSVSPDASVDVVCYVLAEIKCGILWNCFSLIRTSRTFLTHVLIKCACALYLWDVRTTTCSCHMLISCLAPPNNGAFWCIYHLVWSNILLGAFIFKLSSFLSTNCACFRHFYLFFVSEICSQLLCFLTSSTV